MILIGLTGGIAAGKTKVAEYIVQSGLPVISMDLLAKSLYKKGEEAYHKIVKVFGQQILNENKEIDLRKLSIVFGNKEQLNKLNNIVHPLVFKALEQKLAHLWAKGYKLTIVESAILYQSGLAASMDKIIEVRADKELRLQRAVKQRGLSPEDALERIKIQSEVTITADYVILNNGDLDSLYLESMKLIKHLNKLTR